ncbi:MAG: hypothetical protein ABR577_04205 [Pyrinomonadaceae bacterium]
MELKEKIVVPTAAEPDESLSLPHFDDEATVLAARPVVPLTAGGESGSAFGLASQNLNGLFARRVPVLALIVVAAIAIGVVGGLALSLRRNNQSAQKITNPAAATVASGQGSTNVSPVSEAPHSSVPLVSAPSANEALATPEQSAQTPPRSETRTVVAKRSENKDSAEPTPVPPVTLPVVLKREKEHSHDEREDKANHKDDERAQKRAERAERRHSSDDQTKDAPPVIRQQQVEQAVQQINRIKEIFEGQKP